ncbi:MAG: DUF4139 domain-containing protein, partial [Leptospira sp.]|nr:DUF4139 domain-containing protein [Leptospira sp.]
VRLYQDAAFIRRKGRLKREEIAERKFTISKLPASLQNKSISIYFEPKSAGIKLNKINVIETIDKVYQSEEAKKAKLHYDSLQQKLNLLNNEFSVITSHKKTLVGIVPKNKPPLTNSHVEINLAVSIWSSFQKMIRTLLDENARIEYSKLEEIDNVREDLVVAEAKLDYFKKAEQIVRKSIEVDYSASSIEDLKFTVEYLVYGAEWYPRYSVKVDTTSKINNLSFFALVKNNTGEDWKDIDLSFSAADLNLSYGVPALTEWRIGFQEDDAKNFPQFQSKIATGKAMPSPSAPRKGMVQKQDFGGLQAEERSISDEDEYRSNDKLLGGNDGKKEKEKRYKKSANKAPAQEIVAQEAQALSKDILLQNNVNSRSFFTEENLNNLKSDYSNLKSSFQTQNYTSAIDFGKKAKEKFLRLNEKQRKELLQTQTDIEEITRRSQILEQNIKLGYQLIPPRTSSGGFDYRYSAKSNETILSDNSFNKVYISSEELPSQIQYESSPISQKSAFLTASSVSKNREPLLAGPLDLFVRENFLGTSNLNLTLRGEELKFDLGSDDDIQVERRETKFREKKGIISEKNAIRTNVIISVRNRKSENISVTIVDRIPHTLDKDVSIEMISSEPRLKIDANGIFRQPLNIRSGAEEKITFEFIVRYPSQNILRDKAGDSE